MRRNIGMSSASSRRPSAYTMSFSVNVETKTTGRAQQRVAQTGRDPRSGCRPAAWCSRRWAGRHPCRASGRSDRSSRARGRWDRSGRGNRRTPDLCDAARGARGRWAERCPLLRRAPVRSQAEAEAASRRSCVEDALAANTGVVRVACGTSANSAARPSSPRRSGPAGSPDGTLRRHAVDAVVFASRSFKYV